VIGHGVRRPDIARFRIGSAAARYVIAEVLTGAGRDMAITVRGMTPSLQVRDMPRSLAFYRDVLGFAVVDASPVVETPEGRFPNWVWLALGPAQLMLITAHDDGQRPAERGGARQRWHGDTRLHVSVDDVDAVHRDLQSRLPELRPPVDAPYGMRQLHLRDPDGYGLCFQAPIRKEVRPAPDPGSGTSQLS
jgi:catechol 2,3-dioxygenase-like lactoylglutathione lyase family enzyme